MVMRKLIAILILLSFMPLVSAEIPARKINNLPQGTFKKKKDGTIVHYDKNGKRIGVYKIDSKTNYRKHEVQLKSR